jgi:hypothetical protein
MDSPTQTVDWYSPYCPDGEGKHHPVITFFVSKDGNSFEAETGAECEYCGLELERGECLEYVTKPFLIEEGRYELG